MLNRIKFAAILILALPLGCFGREVVKVDVQRLTNAIYKAEGGNQTRWPYGILKKYKKTTPRQACINTIKSAQKRFAKQTKEKDFVHFLSLTYCPIGVSNDPQGLNRYWEKNVRKFYNKGK